MKGHGSFSAPDVAPGEPLTPPDLLETGPIAVRTAKNLSRAGIKHYHAFEVGF